MLAAPLFSFHWKFILSKDVPSYLFLWCFFSSAFSSCCICQENRKKNTKYILYAQSMVSSSLFTQLTRLIFFHHLFMLLSLTSVYSPCSLVFSCSSSTKVRTHYLSQQLNKHIQLGGSRIHLAHYPLQPLQVAVVEVAVSTAFSISQDNLHGYSGIIYTELCFNTCQNLGISVSAQGGYQSISPFLRAYKS